jgi:hypothetical protein
MFLAEKEYSSAWLIPLGRNSSRVWFAATSCCVRGSLPG